MIQADEAIVMVGEKKKRSYTIDAPLKAAVENSLLARQALLPKTVPPRLDTTVLPVVDLEDSRFIHTIFGLCQR